MRVRDAEEEEDWTDEPFAETSGDEPDLGPDERDSDLLDGSWEMRYYAGRVTQRDWTNVYIGIGILIVVSLVLPAVLVLTR